MSPGGGRKCQFCLLSWTHLGNCLHPLYLLTCLHTSVPTSVPADLSAGSSPGGVPRRFPRFPPGHSMKVYTPPLPPLGSIFVQQPPCLLPRICTRKSFKIFLMPTPPPVLNGNPGSPMAAWVSRGRGGQRPHLSWCVGRGIDPTVFCFSVLGRNFSSIPWATKEFHGLGSATPHLAFSQSRAQFLRQFFFKILRVLRCFFCAIFQGGPRCLGFKPTFLIFLCGPK